MINGLQKKTETRFRSNNDITNSLLCNYSKVSLQIPLGTFNLNNIILRDASDKFENVRKYGRFKLTSANLTLTNTASWTDFVSTGALHNFSSKHFPLFQWYDLHAYTEENKPYQVSSTGVAENNIPHEIPPISAALMYVDEKNIIFIFYTENELPTMYGAESLTNERESEALLYESMTYHDWQKYYVVIKKSEACCVQQVMKIIANLSIIYAREKSLDMFRRFDSNTCDGYESLSSSISTRLSDVMFVNLDRTLYTLKSPLALDNTSPEYLILKCSLFETYLETGNLPICEMMALCKISFFRNLCTISMLSGISCDNIHRYHFYEIVEHVYRRAFLRHGFKPPVNLKHVAASRVNDSMVDLQKVICGVMFSENYQLKQIDAAKTAKSTAEHSRNVAYENVLVIDFESMFPKIIEAFNLGPATVSEHRVSFDVAPPKHELLNDDVWTINLYNNVKAVSLKQPLGPIALTLGELCEMRRTYKKPKSAKPVAALLKLLANYAYGFAATSRSNIFGGKRVAVATCRYARLLISRVADEFTKRGFNIIYGDTDSLFVSHRCGKRVSDYACEHRLREVVSSSLPQNCRQFRLVAQAVYGSFYILAAKRYVGISHGSCANEQYTCEIKGACFTNRCAQLRHLYVDFCIKIVVASSLDEVLEWLCKQLFRSDFVLYEIVRDTLPHVRFLGMPKCILNKSILESVRSRNLITHLLRPYDADWLLFDNNSHFSEFFLSRFKVEKYTVLTKIFLKQLTELYVKHQETCFESISLRMHFLNYFQLSSPYMFRNMFITGSDASKVANICVCRLAQRNNFRHVVAVFHALAKILSFNSKNCTANDNYFRSSDYSLICSENCLLANCTNEAANTPRARYECANSHIKLHFTSGDCYLDPPFTETILEKHIKFCLSPQQSSLSALLTLICMLLPKEAKTFTRNSVVVKDIIDASNDSAPFLIVSALGFFVVKDSDILFSIPIINLINVA